MSVVACPSQYVISPTLPGMLMPYLNAVPANRPDEAVCIPIDPSRPASLYQLANVNRAIRHEAAQGRSSYVSVHSESKTTLWNGEAPYTHVDVIFHNLKREMTAAGTLFTIDRSIPLAERTDLKDQSFKAQTKVTREILGESEGRDSCLTKSIVGEQRIGDGTDFRDEFVSFHLTGPTLLEFWESSDKLKSYDPANIAQLAIGLSTYVFLHGGNVLQPEGLFLVDVEGMPVVSLDEYSYDLRELDEVIAHMDHPLEGITVATPGNPSQLKMVFKGERNYVGVEEPHVDITVTSVGENNVIVFGDDVFADIWNHIEGRIKKKGTIS